MMAIRVVCACGRTYQVPEAKAGQQLRCKACLQILVVPGGAAAPPPGPPDTPPPAQRPDGFVRWHCDCGKRLKAPVGSAGKPARCNRCGKPCVVPRLGTPAAAVEDEEAALFLKGSPAGPAPWPGSQPEREEVEPLAVRRRAEPPAPPAEDPLVPAARASTARTWLATGLLRRLALGAAGLLGLVVVVGGVWWLLSDSSPCQVREWYTADEVGGFGSLPGHRLTPAGQQLGMTYVVVTARLSAQVLDKDLVELMKRNSMFSSNVPGGGYLGDFHLVGPPGTEPPFPVQASLRKMESGKDFEFTGVWLARREDAEAGRLSLQYLRLAPVPLTRRTMRAAAGR